MRVCSIASGSSGNCIYVGSDTTHVLVDVGVSCKRTEQGLNSLDLSMTDIDAILITHEHADHIAGLGVISRKYGIPIYATGGTIEALWEARNLGEVDSSLFNEITPDMPFTVKDLKMYPIKISHDAAEPVGYKINYGKTNFGIVTDLGFYNDYIVEYLKGTDGVLLEANHDVNMLQVGPYPYYLKQRILSDKGHLSNENCGRLLSRILHDDMKQIVLGHLSHENNLPELAYETVRVEVTLGDNPYKADDFPIMVAKRGEPSPVINL